MTTTEMIISERKKRCRRQAIAHLAIASLAILLALFMLVLGRTVYPFAEMIRALQGENIPGVSFALNTLRLPRMLAAVFAGIAFGLSGSSFQSLLRNSLASPDVIGVTSGASAAAVVCMLFFGMSGMSVSLISVATGVLVALIIYRLSGKGSFGGGRLIIIGIGIGAMLNSVISFVLVRASQYDVPVAMRWLTGSLNGSTVAKTLPLVFAVFILGSVIISQSERMRMFALGEEMAAQLGVNIEQTKLLIIIAAVGLAAVATSVTGPIAFVSFLSGPIAARLVGTGRAPTALSALVGATLVLGADLIGQFFFDTRFPVGAITGVLGAPYLMFLLVRQNSKGGAI